MKSLPSLNYGEIRHTVRNADLILCHGNRFLHRSIRFWTGSHWNHAAIVFWWGDRVVMLESGSYGVATVHLSRFINEYPGDVALARCRGLSGEIADRIRDAAIEDLRDKYDTWTLPRLAVRKALGKLGFKWKAPENDRYYCSEWVRRIFVLGGGVEFRFDEQGIVSPGAIADNSSVDLLGTLV